MGRNQFLRILARRWYILVVALLCSIAAISSTASARGVYDARLALVFLPPTSATIDNNTLGSNSTAESLVEFAGIVEREYHGNAPRTRFSSTDATLYGAGIRSGTQVFQPNSGGQWTKNFNEATLIVESVESTRAGAVATVNKVIAEIQSIAARRQADAGVAPQNQISVIVSDETSRVFYIDGDARRAAAALLALGLGGGVGAAIAVDRWVVKRRARRQLAVD